MSQALFQQVYFRCVRSNTTLLKQGNEGIIQQHKEACPYCISAREEKERENKDWQDGAGEMRFILHTIHRAKEAIELAEKKIAREKREKRQSWEIEVSIAQYDIRNAKNTIEKELVNKHKLLKEKNPNKRAGAQYVYHDEYLKKKKEGKRIDWL